MTRYARVGNSQKHKRPPGEATPWEELSGKSKKNSNVKDGKFNRVQKGRIEKNKSKGNKVGSKSLKLPIPQLPSGKANNIDKQITKDSPNKNTTKGILASPGNLSGKKKSPKKRKKNRNSSSNKNDSKASSRERNVTLDKDTTKSKKKIKKKKKDVKGKNKVLTKNQLKKAWKKKKLAKLKAKELGQNSSKGKSDTSANKNSDSLLDKEFLNKKTVVLEKINRKKSLTTPLPSKVERRIFYIKKKLREKGLSQSAIKAIVDKEQKHEEEKFLKTCTTKPCFNCRQVGHLLSNCPLRADSSNNPPTGACYKCGSSDHTSNQCNKKIQGFPHAKCFVCKEQGHISKDCPKNKHGLYVKGGGCSKCGNVNHLHKDCPTVKKRKEEEGGFILHTIDEGTSVDEEIIETAPPKLKKKPNKPKVVKF